MCGSCFYLRKNCGKRMVQTIMDHAIVFEGSLEMVVKSELIPTYTKLLSNLRKNKNYFLNNKNQSTQKNQVDHGLISII